MKICTFIFIIIILLDFGFGANQSSSSHLSKISTDLNILSQILKSISLQKIFQNPKIPMKTLDETIQDFLGISELPETILNLHVAKFKNFPKISTSPKILENLKSTISLLEFWREQKLDFGDFSNFSENLENLKKDSVTFWNILELSEDSSFLEFFENLQKIQNSSLDEMNSTMDWIYQEISENSTKFEIFKSQNNWKIEFQELLEFSGIFENILKPISGSAELLENYQEDYGKKFKDFKENLENLQKNHQNISEIFQKIPEFQNSTEKIQQILKVSETSRKYSNFPKNPETLLKSPWFLEFIVQTQNPSESVKKLQSSLGAFFKIFKKLENLQGDFEKIQGNFLFELKFNETEKNYFQNFQNSLENFLEQIPELKAPNPTTTDLENLQKLFKNSKNLNKGVLILQGIFQNLTEEYIRINGTLILEKIQEISENSKDPKEIRNIPKFEDFLNFLNSTIFMLKPFGNQTMKNIVLEFQEISEISTEIQEIRQNLEETGILDALENLKNFQNFSEIQKLLEFFSNLQNIQEDIKNQLENFEKFQNSLKSLRALGVPGNSRKRRNIKSSWIQNFQEGVKILISISEAYQNDSIKSQSLQKELENLEQFSKDFELKMSQAPPPKNFLIYQEIFQACSNISVSQNLDFASSESKIKLKSAESSIPEIRRFFDEFFGIQRDGMIRNEKGRNRWKSKKESMGIPLLILLLILISTTVLIGIIIFVYMLIQLHRRKKIEEKLGDPATYELLLFTPENRLELHDGIWSSRARFLMVKKNDFRGFKRQIKNGCFVDARNQSPTSANTLLHEAVLLSKPKFIRFLLKKGADPKLLNHDYDTSLNLAQKSGNLKIMAIFRKFRRETDILKVVPRVLKSEKFVVEVEKSIDKKEKAEFLKKFRGNQNHHEPTTHLILKTDKNLDLLVTEPLLLEIFSPKMLMSHFWMSACLKDPRKFSENREFRVRNLIYKGEIFENLETIKMFLNKCKVPFLCGTSVSFHGKDRNWTFLKSTCDSLMATTNSKIFPPPHPSEGNQYYRSDLGRNWLVYRKEIGEQIPTIYAKFYADKRFAWFSDEDFIGYLLDFNIQCDRLKMVDEEEDTSRNSDYEIPKTSKKPTNFSVSTGGSKSTSNENQKPKNQKSLAPTHDYVNLTPQPKNTVEKLTKKNQSKSREHQKTRKKSKK